jgi:hypothetical protein
MRPRFAIVAGSAIGGQPTEESRIIFELPTKLRRIEAIIVRFARPRPVVIRERETARGKKQAPKDNRSHR